jgi:uncharacterized membrane protein HdeD (DUF308 family)
MLVSVCAVGIFFGVLVALAAGFPVFLALRLNGRRDKPLVIALWSAVLGAASYYVAFMAGSPPSWDWVSTGGAVGFMAGGIAALAVKMRPPVIRGAIGVL